MKKKYFIPLIIGLFILASISAYHLIANPFIWIFLIYSILFALGVLLKFGVKTKILLINISIILFTLSIFEGYLATRNSKPAPTTKYSPALHTPDDKLGYRVIKESRIKAKKTFQGESVYDVVYTIDSNGLRVAQKVLKIHSQECIVFFGGSLTFGEGVNDDETMPFRVGIKIDNKYRIYNFGVIGYGPHQMLAAIEFGLVKKVLKCIPKYFIFQTTPQHIKRSAGQASWDQHGPLYMVGPSGEAEYKGSFSSNKAYSEKLKSIFAKSRIYSKIWGHQKPISLDEALNYLAIIRKARNTLKERYPKASFQALYWDFHIKKSIHEALIKGFQRDQIPLHIIGDIIPDMDNSGYKYVLSKYDGHPNPMTHNLIAQYVADKIIN